MVELVPALALASGLRRPRYLHIGDSLTQGSGEYRASTSGTRDLTLTVAMASGGIVLPIGNGGLGGQTSPMIAARMLRALKLKPDLIGVTMGTNDAITLGSSAYIVPSLDKIRRACDAAGVAWFVTTIPPNNNAAYQANIAAINTAIRTWATAYGVRLVDIFTSLVAGDGVSWQSNASFDGTHWTSKTGLAISRTIWAAVADLVPARSAYRTAAIDPSNLVFAPIANTGEAASGTAREPLMKNHRAFTQNGFTVDLPYLFATQYAGGTAPTVVSSTYATASGVQGNVWTLTLAPTGGASGAYYAESGTTNRIDITGFQGRRIRIGFLLGTSGFGTDNTDTRLATAGDVPLSGFGLMAMFYDADGTIINTGNFADPVDTTGTVSGASGSPITTPLPLDLQMLFGSQGATAGQWMLDHELLPVFQEINVPAGAVGLNFKYQIGFATGATAQVSVSLAELSVIDVGPLDLPETPVNLPYEGTRRLTATTTIRDGDPAVVRVWRCDATAAAFTVNLPAAKLCAGRTLVFKKVDASANAVTLDASGSETIDGALTLALSAQWATTRLYSNGKSWDVV